MVPPAENPRLAEWLREWQIHKAMLASERWDPAGLSLGAIGECDALRAREPRKPVCGDIRLLPQAITPGADRPVYVALLDEGADGEWRVAPYSRFSLPALPGEMATGETVPFLSVLCLWNTRCLNLSVLACAWHVRQLAPETLGQALRVLRAREAGQPVPAELAALVGPPLRHPLDPRHEYADAERAIWDSLRSTLEAQADAGLQTFCIGPLLPELLPIAASGGAQWNLHTVVDVPGLQARIHVLRQYGSPNLGLFAVDANGSLTQALDRFELRTVSGPTVGIFAGAGVYLRLGPIEPLELRAPDGALIPIQMLAEAPPCDAASDAAILLDLHRNPKVVTLFSDHELVQVLTYRAPLDDSIITRLVGEALLRRWLYQGAAPNIPAPYAASMSEVIALADRVFTPMRRSQRWDAAAVAAGHLDARQTAVWNHLSERVAQFLGAEGLVPVIVGATGTAIVIPFSVIKVAPGTDVVRGWDGEPVDEWSDNTELLGSGAYPGVGIQLGCAFARTRRHPTGDSLELPVAIALARRSGQLPEFPVLSLMASGSIAGERVGSPSGLAAKQAVARKLGVNLFIAPGVPPAADTLACSAGVDVESLLGQIGTRLEQAGLGRADAAELSRRVNTLGDAMHRGDLSLDETEGRLTRLERLVAATAESAFKAESQVRVRILRAALANHQGRPEEGTRLTREAAHLAAQHRIPTLYANAIINGAVSASAKGLLDEAAERLRGLLVWTDTEFAGSIAERKRALMAAHGALGGQVLLQQAVATGTGGAEALEHLQAALDLAQELMLPEDICRDAVQLALWHALLAPSEVVPAYDQALALLDVYPQNVSGPSRSYLHRTLLLGSYRALAMGIAGPSVPVMDLILPSDSIGQCGWVRATALKYRGSILAAQGDFSHAESDFAEAFELLRPATAPLLRLIAGTVGMQAAESLGVAATQHQGWLAGAIRTFEDLGDWGQGPYQAVAWFRRSLGVLKDGRHSPIPSPQRQLIY